MTEARCSCGGGYEAKLIAVSMASPGGLVSVGDVEQLVCAWCDARAYRVEVVAMLGPGDFFGEGVLTGQTLRMGTATAVVPCSVLNIF